MITKLTVAPCKWENGTVKETCKREKGKKGVSHFPFPVSNEPEVGNEFSHLCFSPLPPQTKHAPMIPFIINPDPYWSRLHDFKLQDQN